MAWTNAPDTIEEAREIIASWASLTDEDMPEIGSVPTAAHIAEARALIDAIHEGCSLVPAFLVPYEADWSGNGQEFEVNFDGTGELSYLIDHTPGIGRDMNPAKYTVKEDVSFASVIEAAMRTLVAERCDP
jgi:hypothetical protein